jgi:hypothetical protein
MGNSAVLSHISPASRPDLALTLVTQDGATALALLPKDPTSRLQLFDTAALNNGASAVAAAPQRDALLLQAGTKAGVPSIPASYVAEAQIVDFVVAFMKGNGGTKLQTILTVAGEVSRHIPLPQAITIAALLFYGVGLDPNALASFLAGLKQSTPNKGLAAFFKRAQGDKTIMNQLLAAGTDYAALARAITAAGFPIGAQDLQNYLTPWQFFAAVLIGLKSAGTITQAQYDERIGYQPGDYDVTGFGPEVDQAMIYGLLSAAGWVTRLGGFSEFSLPMQLLMIPVSTIMLDGLTGEHNFSFKELGPMFFNGFTDALQSTVDTMQSFGNDVSSIF